MVGERVVLSHFFVQRQRYLNRHVGEITVHRLSEDGSSHRDLLRRRVFPKYITDKRKNACLQVSGERHGLIDRRKILTQ